MNQHSKPLLDEVEAFLAATQMGPSYFGKKAAGNSELVKRLRDGRPVLTDTAERVREFIARASEAPDGSLACSGDDSTAEREDSVNG